MSPDETKSTSLPSRVLAVNGQFPVGGECRAGDGMATSSFSNNANKNTKNLVKGVEKMFKKFPPGIVELVATVNPHRR
jgi:hypothetical protein